MTQEEKAKAYDEAIERSKNYYSTTDSASDIKLIGLIFPELKESEGERMVKFIKKQLFNIKKTITENYELDVKLTKAIDWLEKQGEQKPADKVEPRFKVGDIIKNKKNGDTVKVEQILSDSYCYSGWDGAATVHSDFSISEQDDWELVELTAWSEEGGSKYSEDDIAAEEKAEYNKGFECGKQRVLKYPEDFDLCKNPAWSKEDETRIKQLLGWIDTLKNYIHYDAVVPADLRIERIDKIVKLESWLKSPKQKNRWKPSEGQMDALNYVVNLMASSERPTENDLYYNILKSLRQQLKKLREEIKL